MDVKSIILGFLMYGSMTGYELKKFFTLSFSFFSELSYGSIYPALRGMEKEGLITMQMEVQDGAPNRKVYTITEAGKRTFIESLQSPFAFERHRSAFLTRLFFFAHLSPEERLKSATRYLDSVREVQAELESARPEITTHADRFQNLCYRFGQRFFSDLVRNISRVVKDLEANSVKPRKATPRRSRGKAS
jgi:DNA-binding PadR family transcriptional regulator